MNNSKKLIPNNEVCLENILCITLEYTNVRYLSDTEELKTYMEKAITMLKAK